MTSSWRRSRVRVLGLVLLALAAALAGCGGSDDGPAETGSAAAEAGDPRTDKLAQVLARETLVLSTDPEYPPQSYGVKNAKRWVRPDG